MAMQQPATRRRALTSLAAWAGGSALLCAGTPALAWPFGTDKSLSGSGRLAQDKRAVTGFHALAVSLPGTVTLVQGTSEGVEIEADDNLLSLIETVVENGELRLRIAKGYRLSGNSRIRLTVRARQVDSLSVSGSAELTAPSLQTARLDSAIAGSGRITLAALRSERLSVSISGSGDFEARGSGQTLEASIAGSGNLRLPQFAVQNATVDIAGSGDATLWVRQALAVSIAGSGDVRYYGEGVSPTTSVVGSGKVRALGAKPPGV
jgi:hypothetical protein